MKKSLKTIINSLAFLLLIYHLNVFGAPSQQSLIVEPNMGRAPIVNAISRAKHSIKLVMYIFSDNKIANALIKAHQRGVKVTVLIQRHPYKQHRINNKVIKKLKDAGIKVIWSNPKFVNTHQKTLIIDNKNAIIMTFNFSPRSFSVTRNFGYEIFKPKVITQIQQVFNADSERYVPEINPSQLVWSPVGTRKHLMNLVDHAKHSIAIYALEVKEYTFFSHIKRARERGVKVRILMPVDFVKNYKKTIHFLQKIGVDVRYPFHYFIHAKMILVDAGYHDQQAYIGSANLTETSFDKNRELGLIIKKPAAIKKLAQIFSHDWMLSSKNMRMPKSKLNYLKSHYSNFG